jgi:hypothetical protein
VKKPTAFHRIEVWCKKSRKAEATSRSDDNAADARNVDLADLRSASSAAAYFGGLL